MSKEKAKKAKGILSSVEFIIILVFFIAFLTWVFPKCKGDGDPLPQPISQVDSLAAVQRLLDSVAAITPEPANPATPKVEVRTEVLARLYVTIDGLKVRHEPNLKSDMIVQLPLFEEVYFQDEVTEFKDSISLGYEVAYAPWVKIKTRKGHIGWVYGAGVNFYKEKRKGVLE